MPMSECTPLSPLSLSRKKSVSLWFEVTFYRFVKKKFEELYFQSSKPDRVDRVFKIYRTTALDQKLVKKTFKLIDESMRRSREGA